MRNKKTGKNELFTGVLECFCQKVVKPEDQNNGFEMTQADGSKYKAKICQYYNRESLIGIVAGSSVSFFIVALNLILKHVIIELI